VCPCALLQVVNPILDISLRASLLTMSLPTKTKQWILANKPTDLPVLEGNEPTFTLETKDIPALQDGEVLLETLYLSNDPAQRHLLTSVSLHQPCSYPSSFDPLTNTQRQRLHIRQGGPRTILRSPRTEWGSHARTRNLQSARYKSCQSSERFPCLGHMRLV
jgi:hypothetical protein